jgi:hypothetical protein
MVLDSATHKPLAGVSITSIPDSPGCMTDTSGNYILAGIAMGTTGTRTLIIYSKNNYINDTISVWVKSDDTIKVSDIKLQPTNGVFVYNNIKVQQFEDNNTLSNIDLSYFRSVPTSTPIRDIDLRDSSNANISFQFRSSDLEINLKGLTTRFGKSLGDYSKYDFDTLAMYYGASVPLSDSTDFPNDRTPYFYSPLTEHSVIPFYLQGRYTPNNNLPKIYGLLYIKYSWRDTGSNIFWVLVDVKINKNGENNFIPYNK